MVTAILGKKIGMTQLFEADGTVRPATVIKAGPCVVVQAKDAARDGYEAIQIGLVEERPARANKPQAGHYAKAQVPPTRVRREVAVAAGDEAPRPGDQVLVSLFFRWRPRGCDWGQSRQGVPGRDEAARL